MAGLKNVAVCLSGQPRCIEYCYPFIRDMILEPNDADVFVHCWLDESMYGRAFVPEWQPIVNSYRRRNKYSYTQPIEQTKRVRENSKELILSLYEPKGYAFDEPLHEVPWIPETQEQTEAVRRTSGLLSCVSYMKSRYLSNEIKKVYEKRNGGGYFATIFIRFDLMPLCPIEAKTFDLNKIVTPDARFDKKFGVADEWGLSSSVNMDVYAQCFLITQDLCSLPKYRDDTGLSYNWAIEYLCNVGNQIPLQIVSKNYYLFRDRFLWDLHAKELPWRMEAADLKGNRREVDDLSIFMPQHLEKRKRELIDNSWYDTIVFAD